MYAGEQMQDEYGRQVCLFPLERFCNITGVVGVIFT